jgi:DNA-binding transcriptional LysR family regulator
MLRAQTARMDLDDLQHFVDVYESRAEISTRIRSLEKVLRQQLFIWHQGSVRATARGQALYTYARGLLDDDLPRPRQKRAGATVLRP